MIGGERRGRGEGGKSGPNLSRKVHQPIKLQLMIIGTSFSEKTQSQEFNSIYILIKAQRNKVKIILKQENNDKLIQNTISRMFTSYLRL